EKAPDDPDALWGAASLDLEDRQLEAAREKLDRVLELAPEFRRGDASLAYAKVLVELERWPAARAQLEGHIRRWGAAESYLLLARVLERDGDIEAAKSQLETMLARSQGTYEFQYKKNRPFIRQAERMLKQMEQSS
ncbi:MAG: hypothetical protein AAFY15_05945, partial [Cyanobacteria bacterium J06648_11]